MKKNKLKKYINLVQGINLSKIDKSIDMSNIDFYNNDSFESDLYNDYDSIRKMDHSTMDKTDNKNYSNLIDEQYFLKEGDVVINISSKKACVIGKESIDKILTINFLKVEFLNDKLDKWYFTYMFNENSYLARQKERESRSTNGTVSRILSKDLYNIDIPYVSISEQKKIGDSYMYMLRLKTSLKKYSDNLEKITKYMIEEVVRE